MFNSKLKTKNSKLHLKPGRLWLRCFLLAITVIGFGILYREALSSLTYAVLNREGSSHGVFVPFLSAFFLWIKRDTLIKTELKFSLLGIPLIAVGLVPSIFNTAQYHLQIIGFIIFLSGAVLFFLGKSFFKEVSFPLFFLITLVPIPEDTYLRLAEGLRVISFGGSRLIISILGIPFLHEGNFISLHNASLEVAIGCSGIRYLVSYFVFSLAYGYLFKTAFWSRLAVVFSSILISLAASVGRLTGIFVLTHYISPKMAEHWPHVFISWTVFFAVLLILISLDQYFQKRLENSKKIIFNA